MKRKSMIVAAGLLAVAMILTGCEMFGKRTHQRTTSVLQYLYPSDSEHVDVPTIPVLSLPLRVGVAFVPENNTDSTRNYVESSDSPFSEQQKMTLMKQVSDDFKKYPFVQSIELIPSAYLSPRGGFANVQQLKRMFNVDVIVLLSYDQVQFTDQGMFSLTYWTVVGAWVVRGERNDTQTLIDAVVYDISSHKLLFRAPGTSQVKASSTPINLSEQLRVDSRQGLEAAATNLVSNLQLQLELFKDRVKDSPEEYKVIAKPGYTGAGSLGGLDLALAAGLGMAALWKRKNQR